MITIKQLCKGLKSGEIKIDENGHDPFYGWGPKSMIESLERKIKFWDKESKSYKGKKKKWSDRIITDHHRTTDEHITDIERDSPCSKCGKKLGWIYNHEEKKIVCVVATLNTSAGGLNKVNDWFFEYEKGRCVEESEGMVTFEFEVKEQILFGNFFRHQMDLQEKEEEKDEYEYDHFGLNTLAGRKRITEFFASIGTGYQQTTNCSVNLFINKDKTELLIIKDSYEHDEETDEEYEASEELPKLGYKHLGSVSCDMWRYMFLNKKDLHESDKEQVELKVTLKKGKYLVENMFDSKEWDKHKIGKFNIASRIKLK